MISACLLGDLVRYDGQGKFLADRRITRWLNEDRLFRICPEVSGGLPTPRPAAELVGGDGYDLLNGNASVCTAEGSTLDAAFATGAQAALSMANREQIQLALLKSNSPSCANEFIYNGHFTGQLTSGTGVTAALLQQHNIEVFNEHQLDALEQRIMQLDDS